MTKINANKDKPAINQGNFMKQLSFRSELITAIFAAIVLTGIYINLEILMNQTFFQIFEGNLELSSDIFAVFVVILILLITIQYLIRRERPKKEDVAKIT
ncbi:MAG: hypothetical protein ACE5I5_13425 [Candidatus Heimdallarchaeota archaeon]